MFYIFCPLKHEVWLALIGTALMFYLVMLFVNKMETGNKGAVAAVNDEFWYTVKLVLSQCKSVLGLISIES